MSDHDDLEIQERAHRLWEEAGCPEGNGEEFWLEAERQIKEERLRNEVKTPDTL